MIITFHGDDNSFLLLVADSHGDDDRKKFLRRLVRMYLSVGFERSIRKERTVFQGRKEVYSICEGHHGCNEAVTRKA